jgi:uncharacterized protein (TIGR02231 family)
MMRTSSLIIGCWLLLWALPVFAAPSAEVAVLKYVSPDAVTVFEDRARVHRRQVVEVGIGSSEVLFFELPGSLDPSSVRARLIGVPGLVLGVRLERNVHLEDVTEEMRLLVDAIHELSDQGRTNSFQVEELDRRKIIILRLAKILEDSFSTSGGKGLLGGSTSAQIIGAQQWIADRLLELNLEKDRLRLQGESIEKKRQDLVTDLEPLQGQRRRTTWSATVLIQTQEEGQATVELAHDVPGARWIPVHQAILDEANGLVHWQSKAQVLQQSGEDWTDVQLTLSTARSSLGLTPASLVPLRVDAVTSQPRAELAVSERILSDASSLGLDGVARAPAQNPAEQAIDLAGAVVSAGSGPVRFLIRARTTIPADGSTHAVTISEQSLAAELGYQSVPLLSPHVFRRARLINSGNAPLLAGVVSCFRAGSYVGDGRIHRVAAGQQFSQHFGSEGRILVHKEEIEDKSRKSGTFTKKVKLVKAYRITVKSMIDEEVSLELVDRIPVSTVDEVEIVLGSETEPDPEVDEDGIVRWTMSLQKDQVQVFVLQWIATAPREDDAILERIR